MTGSKKIYFAADKRHIHIPTVCVITLETLVMLCEGNLLKLKWELIYLAPALPQAQLHNYNWLKINAFSQICNHRHFNIHLDGRS